MTSTTKVNEENFHSYLKSHTTKQLLTSFSVDMTSTLKSAIYLGLAASVNYHFFG